MQMIFSRLLEETSAQQGHGYNEGWPASIHTTQTILDSLHTRNGQQVPMISALDEAFLATVYISYSKAWVNMLWQLKDDNLGYLIRKKAKSPGDPQDIFLRHLNPPIVLVSKAKYFPFAHVNLRES
jgi:hypothetical protein